jgi:O-antigen ligase
MPSLLPKRLRRSAGDLYFTIFLVTVALCLVRARDLPSVEVDVAGTGISIGPADVALLLTGILAVVRLRSQRRFPAAAVLGAAALFAALVVATAIPNGARAFVAAAKLVELGALTLGAAAFLDRREHMAALVTVIVGFVGVASAWAAIAFVGAGGGRQASFVGEHDLAALATMALAVGLGRVHSRRGYPGQIAVVGIVAGVIGIVLGASLASLIGLYLAVTAILVVSWRRRDLRPAAAALTVSAAVLATAGTLALRQGDLGFLQSWFGPPPETPAQYAASWSQRLIYVYVGGRVFLDRPFLGTGWQGELPPDDFAHYVPDARERFADQPAHYFPRTDKAFIPQQTYDQILFQLGLVGAAVFAALLLLAALRAAAAARQGDPDAAYVPGAWLGSIAGALAGAALFGGSPLTAAFWLALGTTAADSEAGRPR